jgi:hypothetical protein
MIRHRSARDSQHRSETSSSRTRRGIARGGRRCLPGPEFLEERIVLAVGAFAAVPTGPVPPAEIAGGPSSPPPTPLPLGLQYAASETLGAADPVYAMAVDGSGFALSNATNVYTARVDAGGFSVDAGADSWSLTVAGVGYGGATTPLGSGVTTASATANRVEYDYGAISQWFVNGPMGLQQGFTLDQRPAGAGAGDPLTIELAQGGSLVATADPSGTSVTLTRVDGSSSLVYGGLIAYDADGSAVPARMSAEGGKLSILVDDADAVYPLTIDPYVQQARVVGSPAKPSQFFGTAVAMASSGTIAAISATGPSTGTVAGSVYIFTTDGTSWTRRGELTSSDGVPGDDFGVSLAMSADASTLVVGARNVTVGGRPYQGAAYVYRINPTAGTGVQIAKLTAQGGATGDSFGVSTAVNAKGSIIVIGAPQADVGGNVDQGAAYVFAANSPTSFVPAATLTAFDGTAGTLYGYSVAVDATGTIVAAGAPSAVGPNGAQGAVYAYRQGAATKLTANDAAAGDSLGYSVALNHDGTFLLAGAPQVDAGGNVDQGAAYVFTRSWNSWAQTAKLTSLTAGGDKFGSAVAIDPTASTAVVATSLETVDGKPGAGAAYVFERGTGGAWGQPAAARLVASDAVPYARLGYSVAIANGTVLAGAPFTAPSGGVTSQGAAYFFRDPPTFAVTVNPSSLTAVAGVPVTFGASSSGPDARTVRWQVNTDGVNWNDVPGATETWYTLTPTTADSGNRYRAIFTAAGVGSVTTTSATLTVVKATPVLSITSDANPRRIGDPLSITVAIVGAGVAADFGVPSGSVTVSLQRDGSADAPITFGPATLVDGKIIVPGIPTLAVATYTVTATYTGDASFAAATATTSQVVVRGTTTLTASVPASAAVGSRALLTMTLTAHGGLDDMSGGIVVKDGGEPIGYPQTTTVGGVTSATFLTPPLTAGNHYYQFMFLGNPQIQASSTGVYVMSVGGSGASSMAASASPSQAGSRSTAAAAPAVATPPAVDGVALAGAFTDAAAKKTRTSSALSFWRSGPR